MQCLVTQFMFGGHPTVPPFSDNLRNLAQSPTCLACFFASSDETTLVKP